VDFLASFLIKMALAKIFKFKSQAKKEFQSLGPNSLKKGDRTEYEETIIRSFGEFSKNVDQTTFSRLDSYFSFMIFGIILIIVGLISSGPWGARLLWLGGSVVFGALSGFIYDGLNKPANFIVKEDEYKSANVFSSLWARVPGNPYRQG